MSERTQESERREEGERERERGLSVRVAALGEATKFTLTECESEFRCLAKRSLFVYAFCCLCCCCSSVCLLAFLAGHVLLNLTRANCQAPA
jgi:hypothetical protein